jgi:glycerophosphoryl diester phosphodiesterase
VRRWQLIAHRGASADATENTLAAFTLAKQQGADAVECDVRLTRDGTPVVFHDADLVRLAARTERIDLLNAAEVAALRVGDGEPIPTLAEALDWSRDGLPLVIELKAGADPTTLAERVATVVRSIPAAQIACVSSFSPLILSAIATRLPGVPRALISDQPTNAEATAGAIGVQALHLAVGRWLGAPPFEPTLVWTVDDPAVASRLLGEGARGIFTNRPHLLAELRVAA